MIAVVLRGLLGRKLRGVLTAVAIVLGVAMISGTYVLRRARRSGAWVFRSPSGSRPGARSTRSRSSPVATRLVPER
jgi:hypothetical protein